MTENATNGDKSITDHRLCLHQHIANKDMKASDDHNSTNDNHSIVDSEAIISEKWPLLDHRIALKRSTSADSVLMADSYQLVGSYQALMAHTYCQRIDRSTQTPEEWEENKTNIEPKNKEHKPESVQNKSNGQQKRADQRFVANRDQSTQSTEYYSRQAKQVLVTSAGVSPTKSTKSGPIAIPSKLCVDTSRSANSVEELNQEIESLVLRGIRGFGDQQLCDRIPEGHRAPVVELLCPQRTVKTQTLNGVNSSGEESDLSQPESPIFVTETVSTSDSNDVQNQCSSPKINKFLTREPPDGCERIRIVNEDERTNSINCQSYRQAFGRPVQPSTSGIVLLPSRSSAFLPILKTNFMSNDLSADCLLENRINLRKN